MIDSRNQISVRMFRSTMCYHGLAARMLSRNETRLLRSTRVSAKTTTPVVDSRAKNYPVGLILVSTGPLLLFVAVEAAQGPVEFAPASELVPAKAALIPSPSLR
jgi:hypothetical protein